MSKIPTVQFEARKIAYRQTKDGLVVSFVIHPDDVNPDFAVAALGTRYMVVLARIGDDEQPIPIKPQTVSQPANDKPAEQYHGIPAEPERRRFADLPLPQQVALRCNDERFQRWLLAESAIAPTDMAYAEHVASEVRWRCEVKSRSSIQPGTEAAKKWAQLEQDFLAATGQMAEQYR